MGRIAVLVPTDEMVHLAHNILQEGKYSQIEEVIRIETEDSISQARRAIARGASILVARGLQASIMKRHTDVPVVEMVVTAQEMALLIQRARQLIHKERPVIAVVGIRNMFCDMDYFEEIFDISLRLFMARDGDELEEQAALAAQSDADILIGGDTAVEQAKAHGLPSLFLSVTEDSLRTAFGVAQSMDQAIQREKRSQARMDILLDSKYTGTMSLDQEGRVTYLNGVMEELLNQKRDQVLGLEIYQLFREVDREQLQAVCLRKQASYSLLAGRKGRSLLCTFTPVVVDDRVDSILMSCQPLRRRKEAGAQKGESAGPGAVHPMCRFADLGDSRSMERCIARASMYSRSGHALYLWGKESGLLLKTAAAIHNEGPRSQKGFVDLDLEEMTFQEQRERLFSDQGLIAALEGGTLFLRGLESAAPQIQKSLFYLAQNHIRRNPAGKKLPADVRLILASRESLSALAARGKVQEELYGCLAYFSLRVPSPLEEKEEAENFIKDRFREICGRYERYHVLTEDGLNCLLAQDWNEESLELENFLERLILESSRRTIDREAVLCLRQEQREELGEEEEPSSREELPGEARRILQVLNDQGWNREQTARILGISKTTLWRKMKQYCISKNETMRKDFEIKMNE